ncbi:hypothetical protein DFH29DRAFT_879836 [Suillus ampliporus]|nr:hypothetical protein DFH29DRAFT_879836 [Suillus ampliporus]
MLDPHIHISLSAIPGSSGTYQVQFCAGPDGHVHPHFHSYHVLKSPKPIGTTIQAHLMDDKQVQVQVVQPTFLTINDGSHPGPIAHDDSESELDYNESDAPLSVAVGISPTTTQSLASVQDGDMESLKNNNRTLGEKNKILASNQRQCLSVQVPNELKAYNVELSTFACKYGVIAEMFPPEHRILRLPVSNPPPVIISASHYASKSAKELCLVTERLIMNSPQSLNLKTELEQCLQGGRSSEISKLCLMAGHIFGLDSSYFDLSFMKRDTIPEIQKVLGPGTAGGRSSLSKFPPILFTNQEMDPTMSTVFGNWEPLAKASLTLKGLCSRLSAHREKNSKKKTVDFRLDFRQILVLGQRFIGLCHHLLAWGWVTLIFILSPDTSFTKAGVGTKSRLPYAAMFTAYKQLWVTLWDQPCICLICKMIDTYVWQSSSTSNVVTSDTDSEDFTSDLMCLAIANAGCKESDFPGLTTNNTLDIPGPVTLISSIVIPAASESALSPGPAVLVVVPAALAIPVLGPVQTTTALDPNPTTLLPAILIPTVASAGVAAVTVTAASEFPPAATIEVPEVPNVEILPVVVAAPSSGRWGQGRKVGMLVPVLSGPAGEEAS